MDGERLAQLLRLRTHIVTHCEGGGRAALGAAAAVRAGFADVRVYYLSVITRELSPDVPGEQPRIANLVKLNANESPFGHSSLALEAMRAAAVDMTAP
jgi:hypothetical protein